MAERVIQDRWVKCGASTMDNRLDTLRGRADFLAQKIQAGKQAPRGRNEQEYAALMWAIAELSGIGDECRRERAARDDEKALKARALLRRAEHAERLFAEARLKLAEVKARNQVLSDELYRLGTRPFVDAVDPDAGVSTK